MVRSVLDRLRSYLKARAVDPVAWIAVFFIGPWVPAAIYGWSPLLVVNGICLTAAMVEWGFLAAWKLREKRLLSEVVEVLPPASDRWKVAALAAVLAVTIGLEVWIDLRAPSLIGFGVTAFGLSSALTIWYAWARPLLVTRRGMVVGASLVPWRDIAVERDGPMTRLNFADSHFFFGQQLRVVATEDQLHAIESLSQATVSIPTLVAGRGTA